ncbi:MAG: hypothetical protein IRY85_06975 [Micromonosporaceae bacterium]|nr:hypothetical protein [Micromonosporaceae bacterium]
MTCFRSRLFSFDNTYIDSAGRVYNFTRENPAKVLLRWDGARWTGVSLVLIPLDCCETAGTNQAECAKAPAEFRSTMHC